MLILAERQQSQNLHLPKMEVSWETWPNSPLPPLIFTHRRLLDRDMSDYGDDFADDAQDESLVEVRTFQAGSPWQLHEGCCVSDPPLYFVI